MLLLITSKRYYVVGVHTKNKGKAICHYIYTLFPGALNGFCYEKQFLGGVPGVDTRGSK